MKARRLAFAFVLGAATVPAFAPFYFHALALVTLAAFAVLLLNTDSTRAAVATGFAFGLGLLLTGTSWVYVSLHVYGGMAVPAAAFATFVFCAIYASCPAIAGGLVHRLRAGQGLTLLLVFPALWALSDWSRGWLFTGFPWLSLGYSQVPSSPLAGYAPVVGVYGVSLFTALTAGAIALAWLRVSQLVRSPQTQAAGPAPPDQSARKWRRALASGIAPVALAIAVLAGGAGLGTIEWTHERGGEPVSVTLIQGNIPQHLKWQPEQARETLIRYRDMVRASTSRLIVLPETALPMFDINLPPGYLDALGDHARSQGGDLLTGVPEYAGKGSYYNSVVSRGTSPAQTYRKVHLVPFGDYFPLRWALGWLMEMLEIPMSDFSRGDPEQRPIAVAGQKVAVNICYEDVFGEEIIRQLPEATMLANFTNDAWWGRSLASRQHLQKSQMRAIEAGRSMLRATNTGVTAVIDHRGRVSHVAPEFETTVVNAQVWGRAGTTPFVRWGNYAFLTLSLAMIVSAALLGRFGKR